jgi:hypothetical protein
MSEARRSSAARSQAETLGRAHSRERGLGNAGEFNVSRNGQRKGQVGEIHLQTEENGAGQRQKEP